ncbi:hypothetical protein JYK22_23460, partial [Nonomuraea sp. RK-328]|nr:hypothetical protein [Nonomuraea sp. RK-328]
VVRARGAWAVETAVRSLVRRGVPLDLVLRGVRIGHVCLHQRLMDAIGGEPEPARTAESHRVSELLFS